MKTFADLLPFQGHFTAVGLDSSEKGNPPSKFKKVFTQVREAGLKVVAHAGEEGPAAFIREALEELQAVRIDHGVRCLEDPDLVRHLAQKRIPLTTCPFSNVRLCVYQDLSGHPLRKLLDAGVSATANSDDPPYFGGYLLENWLGCLRELALEKRHLIQLAKNSFEGSFLPEKQKEQWVEKIERVAASVA